MPCIQYSKFSDCVPSSLTSSSSSILKMITLAISIKVTWPVNYISAPIPIIIRDFKSKAFVPKPIVQYVAGTIEDPVTARRIFVYQVAIPVETKSS